MSELSDARLAAIADAEKAIGALLEFRWDPGMERRVTYFLGKLTQLRQHSEMASRQKLPERSS